MLDAVVVQVRAEAFADALDCLGGCWLDPWASLLGVADWGDGRDVGEAIREYALHLSGQPVESRVRP